MKHFILIPAALVALQAHAAVPSIKTADYQHEVLTLVLSEAPKWEDGLTVRIGFLDPGAKPTSAYPGCELSLVQCSGSAKDPRVIFIQARQAPDYLEMTLHNSTTHLTRLYQFKAKGRKVLFEEVGKP